ncbi:TPA: hypothetical protein CPT81_09685 [Candidatus Gastranaerophilales bacterium HUM_20]|nr:MAG TPA: hypothetical protein CPT81_09685 [Candidatus Gastranaerophilales bacterium HUM_20]
MYYFPDLDEETRLNMISELELDIRNCSFYEPLSMSAYGLSCYKSVLKSCFEHGDADTLSRQLTKIFFKSCYDCGRSVPSNINQMIAFSDFNRYYIRALLLRAISEDRKLIVYRAKKVINERDSSKMTVHKVYFDKNIMGEMIKLFRNYKALFNIKPQPELLKPNSGLSLRFL